MWDGDGAAAQCTAHGIPSLLAGAGKGFQSRSFVMCKIGEDESVER